MRPQMRMYSDVLVMLWLLVAGGRFPAVARAARAPLGLSQEALCRHDLTSSYLATHKSPEIEQSPYSLQINQTKYVLGRPVQETDHTTEAMDITTYDPYEEDSGLDSIITAVVAPVLIIFICGLLWRKRDLAMETIRSISGGSQRGGGDVESNTDSDTNSDIPSSISSANNSDNDLLPDAYLREAYAEGVMRARQQSFYSVPIDMDLDSLMVKLDCGLDPACHHRSYSDPIQGLGALLGMSSVTISPIRIPPPRPANPPGCKLNQLTYPRQENIEMESGATQPISVQPARSTTLPGSDTIAVITDQPTRPPNPPGAVYIPPITTQPARPSNTPGGKRKKELEPPPENIELTELRSGRTMVKD